MPMKNPAHPGDFIRTEIIEPAGLTVTAAAAALRVSRPALSSLLNGKADLSGEMALRLEKAFSVKMETLMRMQSAYDIAKTRSREREIKVHPWQPPTRRDRPYAARREGFLIRRSTSRPASQSILTSVSSENPLRRTRMRSEIRGWVTLNSLAACACVSFCRVMKSSSAVMIWDRILRFRA